MCKGELFDLKIVLLVLSNVFGECGANLFPSKAFSLFFHFFGSLPNFLSCRVGAYSRVGTCFIATILEVIKYS